MKESVLMGYRMVMKVKKSSKLLRRMIYEIIWAIGTEIMLDRARVCLVWNSLNLGICEIF